MTESNPSKPRRIFPKLSEWLRARRERTQQRTIERQMRLMAASRALLSLIGPGESVDPKTLDQKAANLPYPRKVLDAARLHLLAGGIVDGQTLVWDWGGRNLTVQQILPEADNGSR